MSRRIVLFLVIFSFIFVGFSFAAVENIRVSGDINTEAVNRDISLGADQNRCRETSALQVLDERILSLDQRRPA